MTNYISLPEEKKPQISIIIPLYNKAQYIQRTLDSVLSQTTQDFEVIVVGGKSNDGGEEIVKSYPDSRVKLIQEEGVGVSAARNQGVNVAQSDFIAFLDADDVWLPNFLETILNLRKQHPKAGLYGTGFYINQKGMLTECVYNPADGEQRIPNYFKAKNSLGDFLIMTSFMAIPKDVYISLGGFPEDSTQHEDRCLRGKIALDYDVIYSPKLCGKYTYNYDTYGNRALRYIKEPFSAYVAENYEHIKDRDNIDDIIEFCDHGKNGVILLNLEWNNNRKNVRKDILSISTPKMQFKKWRLYVLSYMPRICFHYLQATIRWGQEMKKKYHTCLNKP